VKSAIVDSGTSFLLLPTSDFEDFTALFSQNYTCGVQWWFSGLFACDCTQKQYQTYPDIKVQIEQT